MGTKWEMFVEEEAKQHLEPGEEILGMSVWRQPRGLRGTTPYYAVATNKQFLLLETKLAWYCKGLWAFIISAIRGAHIYRLKTYGVRKFPVAQLMDVKGRQTIFARKEGPTTKGNVEWKLDLNGVPSRFLEYDKDPSFTKRTVGAALQALPASTA